MESDEQVETGVLLAQITDEMATGNSSDEIGGCRGCGFLLRFAGRVTGRSYQPKIVAIQDGLD